MKTKNKSGKRGIVWNEGFVYTLWIHAAKEVRASPFVHQWPSKPLSIISNDCAPAHSILFKLGVLLEIHSSVIKSTRNRRVTRAGRPNACPMCVVHHDSDSGIDLSGLFPLTFSSQTPQTLILNFTFSLAS